MDKETETVLDEIGRERYRQVEDEGWTPEHDDRHELGELAVAAAGYCQQSTENYEQAEVRVPTNWPWSYDWWKPKNPRRDLIRAAALIVAEIERLDRNQ